MNKKIKIKILLLSDLCCSNGEGNGSDVDVCACFGESGLPEIPAKRFKGLLREKALLLAENNFEDIKQSDIIALFGGQKGKKARIVFDNLQLPNANEISKGLSEYDAAEISQVFSQKRVQTAVGSDGTTKESTLRVIETVNKGNEFVGTIYITDATEKDVNIIKNALMLLRNIGAGKNRGLGEISCAVTELSDIKSSELTYQKDDCFGFCDYTVELLSDVAFMMNSPMQNPDYISGSALMGAFAALLSDKEWFEELFFNDVCFGNAYISDGDNKYIPAPYSMVAIKNDDKNVYNLADSDNRSDNKQYVSVGGYVFADGEACTVLKALSGAEYHMAKTEQKLFLLNRLNKGQVFKGTLAGSKGAIDVLKRLSDERNGAITIGASGTAQYGKCKIHIDRQTETENLAAENGDTLVVEALSDIILVNELGNNTVEPKQLACELKKHITFSDYRIYSKSDITGGYNAKWGFPKKQYEVFSKGTVMVLCNCNDGNYDRLMYIGEQNCEGYGLIRIRKSEPTKSEMNRKKADLNKPVSEDIYAESEAIIKRIEINRLAEKVKIFAIEAAKEACLGYRGSLSISTAMRIPAMYQPISEKSNRITEFKNRISYFEKNRELTNLAKLICSEFEKIENIPDEEKDKMFDLYVRCFVERYKDVYRIAEREAKEA